jgi:archaellum component FlaC
MSNDVDIPIDDDLDIELPDAVLDAVVLDEEDHPDRKHGMPVGIKYGLFGLLFLISVVGTVVIMAFSEPEPVEETLVFDQEAMTDIASHEPLAVAPLTPVTPVEHVRDDVADKDSVERLDKNIHTLEQTLQQTSTLVTKQRDAVARQGSSIQEVAARLEQSRALITEYARQVVALKERLATLEAHVGQNSDQLRQIKTKATRKRQARPAFQLLSIDQWGDRDSVVLELQDTTTVAAVGDTRAGWSIQSIQRPNCIGVIRLSDQAKAKVCKRSS